MNECQVNKHTLISKPDFGNILFTLIVSKKKNVKLLHLKSKSDVTTNGMLFLRYCHLKNHYLHHALMPKTGRHPHVHGSREKG